MEILDGVKEILADILDIEEQEISAETYIVRELGAESIDLLELAISLNVRFKVEVNDGELFLARLREYITEAEEQHKDIVQHLLVMLPFLPLSAMWSLTPESSTATVIPLPHAELSPLIPSHESAFLPNPTAPACACAFGGAGMVTR